ncbi:hypothetical protein H6F42_13470 [Pseudanabaena sp. FACHB-1998]|nr:hypothetical protein [Pseudanabaena sp. FACHB-1998]
MKCPKCDSGRRGDKQNHICADCGRQFIDNYSVLGYSLDVKKNMPKNVLQWYGL